MEAKIEDNKIIIEDELNGEVKFAILQIRNSRYNSLFGRWEIPVTKNNITTLERNGINLTDVVNEMKMSWKDTKDRYSFLIDYQVDAVLKEIVHGSLVNADDCGLGKTIEGFAAAKYQLDTGRVKRIIICCEATIKEQWQDSIRDFFHMKSHIVPNKRGKKHRIKVYKRKHTVMIINYEQIVNDFYEIAPLVRGNIIIFDEASLLKNPNAKRTKMAKLLNYLYVLPLTGTPIENKLEDALNIGKLVDPNWMSFSEFKRNHIVWTKDENGYFKRTGYKNLSMFRKKFQDIAISRRQSDVKGFPPKVVYERFVEMTVEQKRLEDEILDKVGFSMGIFTIFAMIENSTELLEHSNAKTLEGINVNTNNNTGDYDSPKLKELEHIIDELHEKKIVIFTRFRLMVDIIASKLGKEHCLVAYKGIDKAKIKKEFKENPNKRFLVSTDILARGFDIPFGECVINFDILWNPARLKQRIDRCHRITGQQLKVFNLICVGRNGIESNEEYMYKVMGGKKALFDSVMNFNKDSQLLRFYERRKKAKNVVTKK